MEKISKLVKRSFNKYPIVCDSIIYGTLCVGAEFSQQTIQKKMLKHPPEPYNQHVIAKYAIYGTSIGGPLLSVWYRWLDNFIIGNSLKAVCKKVLMDQFSMTPQLLVIFILYISLMKSKKNISEECQQKLSFTFQNSYLFWLPIQTVNFLIVPSKFRGIYVGTCSIAWINILSWMNRKDVSKE